MRNSIRSRRTRHRVKQEFELQLTSLMDVLIILLLFLLKSYAVNSVAFATAANIKLPTSSSSEDPVDALNIVVDSTGITFDGERLTNFKPNSEYELESGALSDAGRRIVPLYDALVRAREKSELLMSKVKWVDAEKNKVPPKFLGTLVLQADKSIRYELLRKVLYTAGAAQFKVFKLVTLKKEE
jgi:biopolymer transport protein ExbD